MDRIRLRGTGFVGWVQFTSISAGETFYNVIWDEIGVDSRYYHADELERSETLVHRPAKIYDSDDRYDLEKIKADDLLNGIGYSRKLEIGHRRV